MWAYGLDGDQGQRSPCAARRATSWQCSILSKFFTTIVSANSTLQTSVHIL